MISKNIKKTEEELSQELIKNLDLLPNILTGLEYKLFDILWEGRTPLTIRKIRNSYITKYIWEKSMSKKPIGKLKNTLLKMRRKGKPETKIIEKAEKELKKLNIQMPSHRRIDNIFKSLESLGIVTKRVDKRKNAKYLWMINPKFIKIWNKRRVEIIKKIKKEGEDVGKNLYTRRVLDFYNINVNSIFSSD